jgi:hypothetical protein
VAEVTDDRRGDDAETVGNRGMEVSELHQQIEQPRVQEGNPAIDEVTLEILVPPSSVRLEDNVFIAQEGVGNGKNVGGDDQDKIVDARIKKVVQGGVDKGAKEGVPGPYP